MKNNQQGILGWHRFGGAFLMPVFRKGECSYGIFKWIVQGEGCPRQPHIRERLQLLPGEQHEREAGKRADGHADDRGVFLREDPVGGGGGAAAAFLQVYGGWREGEGGGASAVFPAP